MLYYNFFDFIIINKLLGYNLCHMFYNKYLIEKHKVHSQIAEKLLVKILVLYVLVIRISIYYTSWNWLKNVFFILQIKYIIVYNTCIDYHRVTEINHVYYSLVFV